MIARTRRHIPILLAVIAPLVMLGAGPNTPDSKVKKVAASIRINGPLPAVESTGATAKAAPPAKENPLAPEPGQVIKSLQTVGLFAAVSLAPAAVLMTGPRMDRKPASKFPVTRY